jgi:hypothetical protein
MREEFRAFGLWRERVLCDEAFRAARCTGRTAGSYAVKRVARTRRPARSWRAPWSRGAMRSAPNATVRVTDCGAKGLGLVAHRDLSAVEVRALTLQLQPCSETVFAELSDHPSRFQSGGVLGLLYGVGALVNSGGVKAPLRLPSARPRIGVRERLVFRLELSAHSKQKCVCLSVSLLVRCVCLSLGVLFEYRCLSGLIVSLVRSVVACSPLLLCRRLSLLFALSLLVLCVSASVACLFCSLFPSSVSGSLALSVSSGCL